MGFYGARPPTLHFIMTLFCKIPVTISAIKIRELRFCSSFSLQQAKLKVEQSSHGFALTSNFCCSLSLCLDPRSFVATLVQCRNVSQMKQLHALAITTGMIDNIGVANKLLYIYAQHKAMTDACSLFYRMKERDNVSWSVVVGGFSKAGDNYSCLETFREFVRSGLRMDNYTLPFALRACRDTLCLHIGQEVHHLVYKFGLQSDVFISAAVVDMYSRCGKVEDARIVFDRMQKRDLVTWTVMISGYADCGYPEESMVLFDRMKDTGTVPDKVTMVTVVFACAKLGELHKATQIHDYIIKRKFSLDVILGTAMIDMYAKCGTVDLAREIFDQMKEKNVISWSSIMSAYGIHGRGRDALEMFADMLKNGIQPNRITFTSIISACSHSGLVDEAREIFNSMESDYLIEPDVKHYTCMVDLLGRAGRLEEALAWTKKMKVDKDEGFWGAILGACRIHGDIPLAEKAAKNLIELSPKNSGYYALLSNIYANARKWEEVAKVRELMSSRRVQKSTGWTLTEINGMMHRFRVGDKSHPQCKQIYKMLDVLREKLELAGYVPDTNFVLHDVDEELKAEFLYTHSEKLAIAFALLVTTEETTIRMTKNLRICGDCHTFTKFVSKILQRQIVARDSNRFHHFTQGSCSCGDYW